MDDAKTISLRLCRWINRGANKNVPKGIYPLSFTKDGGGGGGGGKDRCNSATLALLNNKYLTLCMLSNYS